MEGRKPPAPVSFRRPAVPAVPRGHVELGFVDPDSWMLCEGTEDFESRTSCFHSPS